MLFYKRTVVPVNSGHLAALIKNFGIDDLLGLIEDGHFELAYIEDDLAVATNKDATGIIEHHDFGAIELRGNQKISRMTREERLTELIHRTIGDRKSVV